MYPRGGEPQNSGTLLTMYQEFMYQGGSPFPHGTLFMGGDVIPIHKGAATACQRCEMSSFCVLFDGSGIVLGPSKIGRRSCRSERFDGKDIVGGRVYTAAASPCAQATNKFKHLFAGLAHPCVRLVLVSFGFRLPNWPACVCVLAEVVHGRQHKPPSIFDLLNGSKLRGCLQNPFRRHGIGQTSRAMQNSLMCITAFCLSIKCTQTKNKNTGQQVRAKQQAPYIRILE